MWIQWIAILGVLIIICFGIATIYGRDRWQSHTDQSGNEVGGNAAHRVLRE